MENSLVVISEEQFRIMIGEALSEALNSRSLTNNASGTDEYLNYDEAVSFFKISKPTFAKIRSKFPSYKPCENRVLFKKSDLEAYLESCKTN